MGHLFFLKVVNGHRRQRLPTPPLALRLRLRLGPVRKNMLKSGP